MEFEESDKMGSAKNSTKSKRESISESKKKDSAGKKINAKMFAIALIFIMLFVSYTVIFSGQDSNTLSKNMVFSQDQEELGTYSGSVRNINEDLSDLKITIWDSNAKSKNITLALEDGIIIETQGNFNCTFFDKNSNGKLDSADEFIVHNASVGDWIKIYLKSIDSKLAYYTF